MRKQLRSLAACAGVVGLITLGLATGGAAAPVNPGPIGQGFTITPSDLAFILKQVKIAERHSRSVAGTEPTQGANPDPINDPDYCQSLVGSHADQIPDYLTAYGLRLVDGGCNNLVPSTLANPDGSTTTNANTGAAVARYRTAQADQPFPRLAPAKFRDAEPITPSFPVGPPGPTSYTQKSGVVIDSQPRVISNLIVDQTSTNPAAVAAAGSPVRAQSGVQGVFPCDVDGAGHDIPGSPAGCVLQHHTLFIPNVTTDVGLSPPYNSLFTFFGQFFDHGVDQTVKSGGTVFVPLKADDPLRTLGPDGIAGNGDEVPASQAFMVLTRAQNQPGPDGIFGTADDTQDANNTDTPWVDQSQTYTSHPSHQVFLREYELNSANRPVSTGKLLGGIVIDDPLPCAVDIVCYNDGNATTGSIGTWAATKKQAAEKLGLLLQDKDVTNIPMIAVDPYGKFIPGPARGLPQYVLANGQFLEGNIGSPVPVPANAVYFDTPFLTDIAHNADPSPQDTDNNPGTPPVAPIPDADNVPSTDFAHQPVGTYDDEMLNDHFICGDGRCNENIALSTIHQVFHHEHDRLVDYIKNVLTNDATDSGLAALHEWQLSTAVSPDGWNGERLFQAARFITEMEYQHLVFEEFGRKIQPAIRPFHVYNADINAAIPAEFAHAVYRFGHSMLDDQVARTNMDGSDNSLPLLTAFLNPPEFFNDGHGHTMTPEQAAGSVVMGSSDQVGNELDEFVTETLRNNLLGLPLDLATLNLTRARDAGIPPLNQVRRSIFARTNDGQLTPYTSWTDFGQNIKHPESLINFVAAYGTHPSIVAQTTAAGKRAAARAIVDPIAGDVPPPDAGAFMFGTLYPGAAAVPAVQAVQSLTWAAASTPGPFTLTGDLGETAPIQPTDAIADVETALDAVVTGGVTVSGGPTAADGFVVTFDAGGPVANLVSNNTDLGVTTTTPGVNAVAAIPAADWRSAANGVTTTGLDSVDLWVGGLAEITNLFGGLLGSTFNYVFQNTMENLQDGDRLYYLNRTPGMNLRTQLEGNSFSELITRNTDGVNTLKADAFATADCKFQLGAITFPASNTPGTTNVLFGTGTVNDDPLTTDCNENKLLLRKPDGTIQYRQVNSVDPVGINGQSVYNGTDGVDRVWGGNDNDTFWGGLGNDVIEGNGGDDIALGGEGNDIVTDLSGADVEKGGPGNDALDGGIGDDIFMGGDGSDVINGGANDNETFAGPGNDFIIAGQGADAAQGDGGDDWIQGGSGQDLLIGDHGAPFFDDPAQAAPGNDVFVGQVGENDYDTEGGDDLMAQNAAIDRNAGAGGFDWAFHQYNTVPALDDMEINNNLVGVPIQVVVNRDRWQETEADSGAGFNDDIKGTSVAPNTLGGAGFTGCDALDPTGVARIDGLGALVSTFPSPLAPIEAASAAGHCPLNGADATPANPRGNVWAEGDILIGGLGSDNIEGRGADDIIDGDRFLQVRIGVKNALGTEIGSTDLLEHQALTGTFGTGTTGMTLQQAVFAGLVDPGNMFIGRQIVTPSVPAADCGAASPVNCDTALFSAAASGYDITFNANGSVTVSDANGAAVDGTDTLWNVERAGFCTATDANGVCTARQFVALVGPTANAPVAIIGTAPTALALAFGTQTTGTTSASQIATVGNTGTAPLTVSSIVSSSPQFGVTSDCTVVSVGGQCVITVTFTPTVVGPTTATLTVNHNGTGPSTITLTGTGLAPVAPVATVTPASRTFGPQRVGTTSAAQAVTVANTGGSPLAIASIAATGNFGQTNNCPASLAAGANCTINVTFTPTAIGARTGTLTITHNAVGGSSTVALSGTGINVPAAPAITSVAQGNGTLTVNWTTPAANGSPITGYTVTTFAANGTTVQAVATVGAVNTLTIGTLTANTTHQFRVAAINAAGTGPQSALSGVVRVITVPTAPRNPTATRGGVGGAVTFVATWNTPVNTGGNGVAIAGYTVVYSQVNAAGNPIAGTSVTLTLGNVLTVNITPANSTARYRFTVRARNAAGTGPASALSAPVNGVVPR